MAQILIVEDEERIASFVAKGLRAEGHRPTVATDGPTGLDEALSGRYDLMVLDIGLPGMDGHEVARRLRARPEYRGVKLVALTGWGQDADRQRSGEAGLDRHLVKPVDPAALEKLLTSLPEVPGGGGATT